MGTGGSREGGSLPLRLLSNIPSAGGEKNYKGIKGESNKRREK